MVRPSLIHPVYIEIVFLDKNRNNQDPITKEVIGNVKYTPPIRLLAQRGFLNKKESSAQMTHGGDSPSADGYFLVEQDTLINLLNLDELDLRIFKTAIIQKHEKFSCKYKISDAVPVTHYDNRSYLLKLLYEIPKEG